MDAAQWQIKGLDSSFVVIQDSAHRLGRGAMGTVYRAQYFGTTVAAKTLHFLSNPDLDEKKAAASELAHEMQIHSQLKHPNLVQFIGAVFDDQNLPLWILSEYIPTGSLERLLQNIDKNKKSLLKSIIILFSRDILSGLYYLHECVQIIHRDLKPDNILITFDGRCKLCDFGVSKFGGTGHSLAGTPIYSAPEIYTKAKYNSSVDIYSFGITLVRMIIMSFENLENSFGIEDAIKLACEKIPDLQPLIVDSVNNNPSKRKKAGEILEKLDSMFPRLSYVLSSDELEFLLPFLLSKVDNSESQLKSILNELHNIAPEKGKFYVVKKLFVDLLLKIIVVGDFGVGKKNLFRWLRSSSKSLLQYQTIGVDYCLKKYGKITLQLWELAAQERFGNMTRVYYKAASGAIVVSDITSTSNFDGATKWKSDINSKVTFFGTDKPIPCILLANKENIGIDDWSQKKKEIDKFCVDQNFASWFEMSPDNEKNLESALATLAVNIVKHMQELHVTDDREKDVLEPPKQQSKDNCAVS